ncbi:hypothetical protein CFC21_052181 [Triticum aestivum]|uniref:Uncharacterized protein n=3 Tax=Triticum TaxID=4564 RepID=A0A9R0SBD2_TRITD|nr:hypothetical protein CFC21_052181 [Triticum aestivum]VAH92181.1 unnamed protein product [Triticum turgidum subsp. durum]
MGAAFLTDASSHLRLPTPLPGTGNSAKYPMRIAKFDYAAMTSDLDHKRQIPLRIRKSLEGPLMPSTTLGPEQSTTMTVDMYHYTAPKRQDRPDIAKYHDTHVPSSSTTTTTTCTTTVADNPCTIRSKFDYRRMNHYFHYDP